MGKVYQEHESTFTHQGDEYDLNKLFRLTASRKVEQVAVDKLAWLAGYGVADPDRVAAADLTAPLLVMKEKGVYYVLDGFHRLTRAIADKVESLPAKMVTPSELASAKLKAKKRMTVKLHPTLAKIMMESLENEDASGKATQEVEHVFYGKISDPNQLAELAKQPYVTKVMQEQTQCQIMPKGADQPSTLRYRRINRESCVATRKTFIPGQAGMSEESIEVPVAEYDFFSRAFGEGIAKMRYVIKPESWPKPLELDVFVDAHGSTIGYAKFDYEVTSQDEVPPPLPITLTDLKHVNPYSSSDADRALLREFMQSMSFKTA